MSRKKVSAADALKAQLAGTVSAKKRAGGSVAKKALEENSSTGKTVEEKPKPKKPAVKKTVPVVTQARQEKVTVSLHEDDFLRLDEIDQALREAKIPMRGVGNSTLIKLALRGFEAKPEKLKKLLNEVQGQDGRRRKP